MGVQKTCDICIKTQRERERNERQTAKGKTWSEGKGLWPWPLRISLPCWYLVQILNLVSDWLLSWTSSLIGFLNSYPGTTVDIWYKDDSYWLSLYVGTEARLITWKWDSQRLRPEALLFPSGFSFCCLSLCIRVSGTRVRGPIYWLRFTAPVFKKASNLNLKTPYDTKKRSTVPPGASLLPSTCSPTQYRCTAQPMTRSLSSWSCQETPVSYKRNSQQALLTICTIT